MKLATVLCRLTVLFSVVTHVLSQNDKITKSKRQVSDDFLSHKVFQLEKMLFQEHSKTKELERQVTELREKISSLSQNTALSSDSLQNSPCWKAVSSDIHNIKTSLIEEKRQRMGLEETVNEIKENLPERGADKVIKQFRDITKSLTNRVSVIEQKYTNLSCNSSCAESSKRSDGKVVKPAPKPAPKPSLRPAPAATSTAKPRYQRTGIQFDGKPLNENDDYRANDCADLVGAGYRDDGVYNIYLSNGNIIPVRCNMQETPRNWNMGNKKASALKGWLVVQKRLNGKEDFNRTWEEYKTGFGNLESEFWIGNQQLWEFLNTSTVSTHMFLRLYSPNYHYYHRFFVNSALSIGSESDRYNLRFSSYSYGQETKFQGPAKSGFMTWDNKLDRPSCPPVDGGWWYSMEQDCVQRQYNPNSKYHSRTFPADGRKYYSYLSTYQHYRNKSNITQFIIGSELLIYFRKEVKN